MNTTIGQNITAALNGNILTLTIDMSKDFGPSSTGKTRIIASTRGGVRLDSGQTVAVNVYKKA